MNDPEVKNISVSWIAVLQILFFFFFKMLKKYSPGKRSLSWYLKNHNYVNKKN